MKKIVALGCLGMVLIGAFFYLMAPPFLSHPMGFWKMLFFMLLGAGGEWASIEAMNRMVDRFVVPWVRKNYPSWE